MKFCSYGETCLHFAARAGSVEVVKFLLENGVDYRLNGEYGTARNVAAMNNHEEMINMVFVLLAFLTGLVFA
jgi:ankyrin repeat protein